MNKNISTTIGLIVIVIAAIIVAGVLAWQEGWIGQFVAAPTPAPTPDETVNWKTYKNEEYGFEIKYPNQWGNISDASNADIYQSGDNIIFNPTEFEEQFLATGYPFLEMNIRENPQKLDVESFYFPFTQAYETKEQFKTDIIMKQVKDISYYQIPTPHGELITVISLDSNFLEFFHHTLTSEQLAVFNQMLSTFRFVE